MKATATKEKAWEKVKHAAKGEDEPLTERSPTTVFGLVGPVYFVVLLLAILALAVIGTLSRIL